MGTIPSTTDRPVTPVVDARTSGLKPHAAGVLAHGMHAVAHHITEYRLPLNGISVTPHTFGRTSAIQVSLLDTDLEAWLPTVHVDDITSTAEGAFRHVVRRVRLADSGVTVDLVALERGREQVSA